MLMNLMKYPSFIPKPSEIPGIIPGLLLAILVAVMAMMMAQFIPKIGAAPIAIFIGIIAGNLFFKQSIFQQGTSFAEGRLLEYAIVFLGFSVTFSTLAQLGLSGTIFITSQIIGTILLAIGIGKALKFGQNYYLLMAAGNAVCGSSAIAATAPVIDASESERGLIITIVNLMGTIMMFLMPVIALFLYDSVLLQGALIGGTLQSVGQVIASASMLGNEVMRDATIFKIMRIASLILIVLCFHKLANRSQTTLSHNHPQEKNPPKKPSLHKLVPWYLFGFMLACALNSFEIIHEDISNVLLLLGNKFEVIALAAIGLRLNFSLLKQQGRKLAIYALILGSAQIALALLLIPIFLN